MHALCYIVRVKIHKQDKLIVTGLLCIHMYIEEKNSFEANSIHHNKLNHGEMVWFDIENRKSIVLVVNDSYTEFVISSSLKLSHDRQFVQFRSVYIILSHEESKHISWLQ